jgi:peptidylprolyl isomerase
MLIDSSIFDSSILPEFEQTDPYEFVLGNREVILGWEEAVSTMRLGGKRKVVLPPHLGYGRDGYKDVIGPNETLIYYLHLVDIQ